MAGQSHVINLCKEHTGLYPMFLWFCQLKWPDAGIFGDGMAPSQLYHPQTAWSGISVMSSVTGFAMDHSTTLVVVDIVMDT
jgi:hypothetical protein